MTTATTTAPPQSPAPIRMRGITVQPRVTAADTGGALSVLEQTVEPGAGSPPHRCTREHKVITVLDGFFAVLRDGTSVTVPATGCVHVAPGVLHSFTNVGPHTGRVLVALTPGGHEEFLRGLAVLGGPAAADPTELAAHCDRYGVVL